MTNGEGLLIGFLCGVCALIAVTFQVECNKAQAEIDALNAKVLTLESNRLATTRPFEWAFGIQITNPEGKTEQLLGTMELLGKNQQAANDVLRLCAMAVSNQDFQIHLLDRTIESIGTNVILRTDLKPGGPNDVFQNAVK